MAERRALFLDRDGTINIDRHYVHRIEDFEWVPGIVELCRAAQKKGLDIVVITNQSGIERGYFTEADYERLTAHMRAAFAAEGVTLLDVLYCPYLNHPDRKPAPGLFLQAQAKWGIDMAASYSLGDKPRDVQAGKAAGVGHNFLLDAAATVCADAAGIVPTPAALIPFLN